MVSSTQHTLRLAVRLLVSSLLVSGVSQADMSAATAAALDTAIRSDARTDDDRARDSDRLPKETLAFFGFERNMTVVEIFPGAGW